MTGILAIAIILLAALLLGSLSAAIMRRLGVTPADPAARSDGFADVLRKLEAWSRARRR